MKLRRGGRPIGCRCRRNSNADSLFGVCRKILTVCLPGVAEVATFSRPSHGAAGTAGGPREAIFDIPGGLERKRVSE